MRVALVYSSAKTGNSLVDFAKAIAKGLESMGHRADLVNAEKDDGRVLPGYEYIAVLSEPASLFSGKIPESLSKCLTGASSLVGKKSAAFLKPSGLFSGKAMAALMRAMEKEGMWVNWSDLVSSPEQAAAAAKRIGA